MNHTSSKRRWSLPSSQKEIDFFKYTELDPEDDVVFFGPITKRELLISVKVEEEVVRRRIAQKKAEAIEKRKLEVANDLRKEVENVDDDLNRTFDILTEQTSGALESPEKQRPQSNIAHTRVLNDVTRRYHNREEAQLLDLPIQFSRKTSTRPPSSSESVKCLLDETIDFNENKIFGAHLPTPLSEKIMSKSRRSSIPRIVLPVKENKDEKNSDTPRLIKLSDTFIADMIDENVLNPTIPDYADRNPKTVERVEASDMSKRVRNGMLGKKTPETKQYVETSLVKNKSSSCKSPSTSLSHKSPATRPVDRTKSVTKPKTPIHQQNSSWFPKSLAIPGASSFKANSDCKPSYAIRAKSPVAGYIRGGSEIKSMSNKARHDGCVKRRKLDLEK